MDGWMVGWLVGWLGFQVVWSFAFGGTNANNAGRALASQRAVVPYLRRRGLSFPFGLFFLLSLRGHERQPPAGREHEMDILGSRLSHFFALASSRMMRLR
ncbi:hypothetical protein B0T14DRAFT_280073 [Immersiella caudata]|uniref:Uncharacterized protein n=1 Tax=Immersiella caudata TaxID=314043 RepID=A0AA39WDN8_9PEZI|nr:hypothetical protein B0T14DRAFT_280073 [Immersiella caudata]